MSEMKLTDAQLEELHELTNGELYDADYGDFMLDDDVVYTAYYIDINIGRWNKEYEVTV